MFINRLILSVALVLSIFTAVAPGSSAPALASHESSEYADPYSWNSRQAADDAYAQSLARQQEQRKYEERESVRRNEADQQRLFNAPAPAPRHDNGLDYTNSYNGGVFTNCYGTAQTRTCTSTGGNR